MTRLKSLRILLVLLWPTMAQAHPGHGTSGFITGFAHPFLGADHLLAMFAIGLWAIQLGGGAVWSIPASFVATMGIGGMLGMAHLPVPFVEHGILVSILLPGLLIACAARLPLALSIALAGLFAFFHGHAHGTEMPESAAGFAYGLGFIVATASLHGAGIVAALLMRHATQRQWLRYAGAGIGVAGGILFLL